MGTLPTALQQQQPRRGRGCAAQRVVNKVCEEKRVHVTTDAGLRVVHLEIKLEKTTTAKIFASSFFYSMAHRSFLTALGA